MRRLFHLAILLGWVLPTLWLAMTICRFSIWLADDDAEKADFYKLRREVYDLFAEAKTLWKDRRNAPH